MLGYDWPRLHAALNDLPAALLLAAILFDLLGAVNKRDSLRSAGFWCLIAGVLGGALAGLAGEMAESVAAHTDAAHAIMETHEKFALVTLGLFGVLALWRIVRRATPGGREQAAFSTAGIIGVGLLMFTARLGGTLVFEHATGIETHTLEHVVEDRQGGHHHHDDGDEMPHADSAHAAHDSTEHAH